MASAAQPVGTLPCDLGGHHWMHRWQPAAFGCPAESPMRTGPRAAASWTWRLGCGVHGCAAPFKYREARRSTARMAWHGMVITECHLVTSTPSGQISGHARPAPWLAAQMGGGLSGPRPLAAREPWCMQMATARFPARAPSSGLTDLATLPRLSLQLPKLPQTVRVCQRSHLGQRPQRLLTARPDGRRWSGRGETRRSAKQGPSESSNR